MRFCPGNFVPVTENPKKHFIVSPPRPLPSPKPLAGSSLTKTSHGGKQQKLKPDQYPLSPAPLPPMQGPQLLGFLKTQAPKNATAC